MHVTLASSGYKLSLFWVNTGLTQLLTVSVKEKGGKPYPLPYDLRNPYRTLKIMLRKPQWNFAFMNSASIRLCAWSPIKLWWSNSVYLTQATNPKPSRTTSAEYKNLHFLSLVGLSSVQVHPRPGFLNFLGEIYSASLCTLAGSVRQPYSYSVPSRHRLF